MILRGGVLNRIAMRRVSFDACPEFLNRLIGLLHIYVMLTRVKILVAGVGNLLRGDDGFGVVTAHRLLSQPLPSEVRVIDVGIGGIHLVQELFDSPDALFVLDAVDSGRPPGTVLVIRPKVTDVTKLPLDQRHDQLADMHWASPERAFMLARGLGVLPDTTWVIGCQPSDTDVLGEGLSPKVSEAVETAIRELQSLVKDLGIAWPLNKSPTS